MFRTIVRGLAWDEDKKIWNVADQLLGNVSDTNKAERSSSRHCPPLLGLFCKSSCPQLPGYHQVQEEALPHRTLGTASSQASH